MPKEIPLINTNLVTVVDDEDFEWLSSFKWYAFKKKRRGGIIIYAGRNAWVIGQDGKGHNQGREMQRDILDPERKLSGRSKIADHRNHNTLDNQRSNLRLLTNSESNINRRLFLNSSTGMRGVTFAKARGAYRAFVRTNGKRYVSRDFISVEEAARAYNWLALKYHGEFARLNLGKDGQPLKPLPPNPRKNQELVRCKMI